MHIYTGVCYVDWWGILFISLAGGGQLSGRISGEIGQMFNFVSFLLATWAITIVSSSYKLRNKLIMFVRFTWFGPATVHKKNEISNLLGAAVTISASIACLLGPR